MGNKRRRPKCLQFLLILDILFVSAMVVAGIGYYKISKMLYSGRPRKAKCDVTETYIVDWWPNQDKLVIDSFSVKIIDGNLNLFNHLLLVSYTIKGKLINEAGFSTAIDYIHVCERPISTESKQHTDAEILLTPVARILEAKSQKASVKTFFITNERIIRSMHWGQNLFVFRCGIYSDSLMFKQQK